MRARTPPPAWANVQPYPDLILLLMLQDGLQEGPALMTGRLLVEHASLDDLLVHVEFVFGCSQNFLFHAVDRAETKYSHLVLLTDAVSSVLSLQVLREERGRVGSTL